MSDLITMHEAAELAEAEQVIERGIQTFTEVGNALLKIRDGRLYRADFGTFEDYCRDRWDLKRQRAYELMSAAAVVSEFSDTDLPVPAKESHAAALAAVPEPERADVWRETVERTNGKPTAAAIRETARRDPDPEPDAPDHDDKRPDPEPGIWHSGPAKPEPAEKQRPKRPLMDVIEERVPGSKAVVRASNIKARVSKLTAACADAALIKTEHANDALTAEDIDLTAWQLECATTWINDLKKARTGLRIVGGEK